MHFRKIESVKNCVKENMCFNENCLNEKCGGDKYDIGKMC